MQNKIDWNNVGISCVWTLFMSFFTYTTMWKSLLSINTSVIDIFTSNQSLLVSLIVNFGIVLMLIFDYIRVTDSIKIQMFELFCIAVLFTILIYAHSIISVENRLNEFIFPISFKEFGFILHIIFLLLICGMKFVVISEEENKIINLKTI